VGLITVDDRIGSRDLVRPLEDIRDSLSWNGCPKPEIAMTRLHYGDFAFDGLGPDDAPITIAGEIKTPGDLVNCIESRRFVDHQLPGLVNSYNVVYFVVDGDLSADDRGNLVISSWESGTRRSWSYEAVSNFLSSISERPAVRVWQCRNRRDVARFILARYKAWQKSYDEHTSHIPFAGVDLFGGVVSLAKPVLVWRVAGQLPRIGEKKIRDVVARFPTTRRLVCGGPEAWAGIKGLAQDSIRRIRAALDGAE
jgi:hypothetical protein